MEKQKYIFGPVPSRRLGRSLGVNVIPSKICTMDCIYCEVGKTNALTMKRAPYYKARDILAELRERLQNFEDSIDVITITGAGEPTLNSELAKIVAGIRAITDKKIAILTNATLFTDSDVFETLLGLDIVVPSIDAVTAKEYYDINMPHELVDVEQVVSSVEKFANEFNGTLYLEVLLCKGINAGESDIENLVERVKGIKATKVQVGTVFRPPAYSSAVALSEDELLNIVSHMRKMGVNAEVSGAFKKVYTNTPTDDIDTLILNLLKMRPCTLVDIESVLGISSEKALSILEAYVTKGEVQTSMHNDETFYSL